MKRVIWPLTHLYRRTVLRRTRFIAVVGSFGKTTTTRAIACALGQPVRHVGWNAGVFVATALFGVRPWWRHAVVEVGISRPGMMEGYARLVRPDIVVVTGIGSEHGTSLGSLDNTREEKAAMVRALPRSGVALLNADDPHALLMRNATDARIVTYGFAEEAHVRASDVRCDVHTGMLFALHAGGEEHTAATPLVGQPMAYPVLAAVAVAREAGIDVPTALKRLAELPPMPERLELVATPTGAFLLVDSYKGHLETVEAALAVLGDLEAERRLVVLGEVEEPPGSQGPIYRALGRKLAHVADHVVFVGGRRQYGPLRSGAVEVGMPREVFRLAGRSARRAVALVEALLTPGDVVLIKGRTTQKLVRVAYALQGRRVLCDAPFCDLKPGCARCDQLERPPR